MIAAGAMPRTPLGKPTALPPKYPSFAAEKKGYSEHCRKEGGGDEWRDRGRDGVSQEREVVDFASFSKNSCGRPLVHRLEFKKQLCLLEYLLSSSKPSVVYASYLQLVTTGELVLWIRYEMFHNGHSVIPLHFGG